ncbi:SGNH/GDSL hydrolase family protein [Diaminobutyricibacter sp. McL0608]|uniref:SGNH/GDSL hydrolase family protein n=1 Tax=Leifsonia sp. McL0608 TaxID=3143537 RepID=UPI0031F32B61
MTTRHRILAGLTTLLLLTTTACSSPPDSKPSISAELQTELPAAGDGLSRVLFFGDSIAEGLALPLSFAFDASRVEFSSSAAAGGGTVVGELSASTWTMLNDRLAHMKPSTVIYQITTYDWGTQAELEAAYQRLLRATSAAHADLVFVTMPPIHPDDFYAPHMEDLTRTADVARQVVDGSNGHAHLFDAHEVWGKTFNKDVDGKRFRSDDGIHTCPQGAASFTKWLLEQLKGVYPSFSPAAPHAWANTGWASDKHFIGC